MKYRSDCVYVKNDLEEVVSTPVDGILRLLHCKKGYIVVKIKVKRREQLYMYLNQIELGVSANELKFKKYFPVSIDLSDYFSNIIKDHCVDKTAEYKSKNKDKTTVSYHEIVLKYSDVINT